MRAIDLLLDIGRESQSPSQPSTPLLSVLQVDERSTPNGGCLDKTSAIATRGRRATHWIFQRFRKLVAARR